MRPTDLELDLDAYAGPFDLLCTILLKRELELADVRLAEVVVGYVQQLSMRGDVDPDTASEFLVLLASLMEIKVRHLLAIGEDDDVEIEEPAALAAQSEMLERLVQYATFRGAATWLGQRGARGRWWRVASVQVPRVVRAYDGPQLDPQLLRKRMEVLLAEPDVDVRHLVGRHMTVHEMSERLIGILRRDHRYSLDDAVDGMSRLDQAVAFVAVLELYKNGQIDIDQSEHFGPIQVSEYAGVAAVVAGASEFDEDGQEVQIA
jgi:segregation and condensation protein A